MHLAIDVQYHDTYAQVTASLFPDWKFDHIHGNILKNIDNIAPFEAGSFYKRELPCILALLKERNDPLETIIINGYVTLGKENKASMRMHLYHAIQQSTPVIGVARRKFKTFFLH